MKASPFIPKLRSLLVAGVVLAAFGAVGAKLFFLHVTERSASLAAVEKQRNIIDRTKARRGTITDSRGNLLAATRPVVDLGVDPSFIKLTPENHGKII
jgi:cell division protein FtsI/penicillin-binding protein 2